MRARVLRAWPINRRGKTSVRNKCGSMILKWGVNFCNNVIEPINIWGTRKKRKKGAHKNRGGGENSPISPPLDPRLRNLRYGLRTRLARDIYFRRWEQTLRPGDYALGFSCVLPEDWLVGSSALHTTSSQRPTPTWSTDQEHLLHCHVGFFL